MSIKYNTKHEILEVKEQVVSTEKMTKKAKKFLNDNLDLQENELLYIVTAFIDTQKNKIIEQTVYCSNNKNPIRMQIETDILSQKIELKEPISKDKILKFMDKLESTNIYIFKLTYTDSKNYKISSYQSLNEDLNLYLFDKSSKKENTILKQFGKQKYVPKLDFF